LNLRESINSFSNAMIVEHNRSKHTVIAYIRDLTAFYSFVMQASPGGELSSVSSKNLRDFIASLHSLSPRSVSRVVSSLKSFCKFLVIKKLIADNPAKHLKFPKLNKYLPSTVSQDAIISLINDRGAFDSDWLGQRDRSIIALLYDTGMRVSELITVERCNLDTRRGVIKVTGKGNKERLIPLSGHTVQLIESYAKSRDDYFGPRKAVCNERLIYVTNTGKPMYPGLVNKITDKYLAYITDTQTNPHILRHSFATHLLGS